MSLKFMLGVMSGAAVGVAVSAAMLDHMRPDVTSKMMRNGRKVMHRYRRQCGL